MGFFFFNVLLLTLLASSLLILLIAGLLSVYIVTFLSIGTANNTDQIAISSAIVDAGHPFTLAENCSIASFFSKLICA